MDPMRRVALMQELAYLDKEVEQLQERQEGLENRADIARMALMDEPPEIEPCAQTALDLGLSLRQAMKRYWEVHFAMGRQLDRVPPFFSWMRSQRCAWPRG